MNCNSMCVRQLGFAVAVSAAAVLATSCAAPHSAPKQVQASNPTVTYKYRNDDELVQTNQLASTFCERYQSIPHAVRFTTDADHQNVVVYECATTAGPSPSTFNPKLTYTYRTDQELLNGSQNAQSYCLKNGSSRVDSNIVRNGDGTRTVTFKCSAS